MTSKDKKVNHLRNSVHRLFLGDTCLFLDVYISIKVESEESENEVWVYVIHNYYK
jgi:hypothetical protein